MVFEYIEIYFKDAWVQAGFAVGYCMFVWVYVVKYKQILYGGDAEEYKEHKVKVFVYCGMYIGVHAFCCLTSKYLMRRNAPKA